MGAACCCLIFIRYDDDMGASKNNGIPKLSIFIGFSIIKPSILWAHPYFWKHPICISSFERNMPRNQTSAWSYFLQVSWDQYASWKRLRFCQRKYFSVTVTKIIHIWLVVSTNLKNISQNGNLPQIGVKKKYLKPPPRYPLITKA